MGSDHTFPRTVLITGGGGNLGRKLTAHLEEARWCERIIVLDRTPVEARGKVVSVLADIGDSRDARWIDAVGQSDGIVHLAADNPYPDAQWAEACRSFDMTANLLANLPRRPFRFVFASSNHTMGGYKEAELAAGALTPDLPPRPGTRFHRPDGYRQDQAYATAKLMGERALLAAAEGSRGSLTGVSLRIGWCQPGENRPTSLTGDGMPDDIERVPYPEADTDLRWFRNMWLSNRDFLAAITSALGADASQWPARSVTVNAMSRNTGMPWSLEEARRWIGYEPTDDVWDHLAAAQRR